MPRPLLPPRGLFVPTWIIYNHHIPPSTVLTWIQLRALAWGSLETPEISMAQLSELCGKSPSTLYGHMAFLRSWGALRWRPSGKGTLIVTFEAEEESDPGAASETQGLARRVPRSQDPGILEKPSHKPNIEKALDSIEKRGEAAFRKTGKRARNPEYESDPITIYRLLTGLRPNQPQREAIQAQVSDPDLWRLSVEHWQTHRWNPKNIPGMLDLYQRGGPAACRGCRPQERASSLEALEELRKELSSERIPPDCNHP